MGENQGKRRIDESGLSLVELLAALVILGIVFISFMTIFPQMTNFNEKTGAKLKTMNIARQEKLELQDDFRNIQLNEDSIESNISADTIKFINPLIDTIEVSYKKGDYDYIAKFFTKPDLSGKGHSGNNSLYKVHLKVMINEKMSSETYGYIYVEE